MSQFFLKYPRVAYDMTGTGNEYVLVTDIIRRVQFLDVVRNNAYIYYDYTVKDEETPEIIAAKLYDSAQYHWVVLFANDIYLLWRDWPLSYQNFINFLEKTYGDVDTSMTLIHHYEDVNGYWIDEDTYNASIADGAKVIYAYDYELALNDAKKEIKLIDAKYVRRIENELDSLLTPTKR